MLIGPLCIPESLGGEVMTTVSHLTRTSVAVIAMASLCGTAVAAEDTTTWRVQSHWPSASSSYEDSLEFLRDRLLERTDGRLELELHEAGSLFSADEIFNATERGVIEMGTLSPGYVLDRSELAGIAFGLPNSYRDVWEALYFFRNEGFEEMLREDFAEQGVYWSTDKLYATELVLKEPVEDLDDFESLQLRSTGTLQTFLTEAGAAASSIPGEELYQALSTGVVDGAHWGAVQGASSMSLYEVAKYHVRPPLIISTDAFVINQEAMDSLPKDVKDILIETLNEHFYLRTLEYQYKEELELADVRVEQDVEVIEMPDDVQSAMDEAAQGIWEQERQEGDKAAEAVERLEEFLTGLGYLD